MTLASVIPKVHLHCHLEGSLRAATFVELAGRHGVPLRYDPAGPALRGGEPDPADPYRFADFREFLWTFAAVSRALADPDDYGRLAREFVQDALAQNVAYGELFVSPSVWTFFHPELDVRAAFANIAGELRSAASKAEFRLIVDLTRNFGSDRATEVARLATRLDDCGIVGVGLGGDEARFPPEAYAEAFALARASGLRCVAHAGEAAGPQSVQAAVETLGAERIGHGISALRDPEVVAMLADRRIPLEICPTSNERTGVALDGLHALAEFERAGCIVTIDADDPALFGTSIEAEYARVEGIAGGDALARYVGNAIDASFARPSHKRELHARLAAELRGVRRSTKKPEQRADVGP
ncbi:MAG: adenosine deaminase [Candidatus Tumulicola sp.]